MSRIVVTVDAAAPCFDALVAMMRNNVHHLPVLERGRLRRVITNHDLMLLLGSRRSRSSGRSTTSRTSRGSPAPRARSTA